MTARGGGIDPLFLILGTKWNWRNWTHIFLHDCMEEMVRFTHRLLCPPSYPKEKPPSSNEWEEVGPQSLSESCGEENKINYKFKDFSLVADRVRLLDWRLGWIPLNFDRISSLISSSSLWSPVAGKPTASFSKYASFFYSQGSYFRGIEHPAIGAVALRNKIKCRGIDNAEGLQWSNSSPWENGKLWREAKCV